MHPDRASAVMIAVIGILNARTTRTGAIPQNETAPVLHRVWLKKGFLRSRVAHTKRPRPVLAGRGNKTVADQADTPTPIGHDTPVPPNPQYPPGFLARYC